MLVTLMSVKKAAAAETAMSSKNSFSICTSRRPKFTHFHPGCGGESHLTSEACTPELAH